MTTTKSFLGRCMPFVIPACFSLSIILMIYSVFAESFQAIIAAIIANLLGLCFLISQPIADEEYDSET